jgi:hypothetical protein
VIFLSTEMELDEYGMALAAAEAGNVIALAKHLPNLGTLGDIEEICLADAAVTSGQIEAIAMICLRPYWEPVTAALLIIYTKLNANGYHCECGGTLFLDSVGEQNVWAECMKCGEKTIFHRSATCIVACHKGKRTILYPPGDQPKK